MALSARRNPSLLGDLGTLILVGGALWLVASAMKGGGAGSNLGGGLGSALGNLGNIFGSIASAATGSQLAYQQLTPTQVQDYLSSRSQGYTPDIAGNMGQAEPGKIVNGTLHEENGVWTWAEWGPNGQLVTKQASGQGLDYQW